MKYIAKVTNDKTGEQIRARHFSNKKGLERYEDNHYQNPMQIMFTLRTYKIEKGLEIEI